MELKKTLTNLTKTPQEKMERKPTVPYATNVNMNERKLMQKLRYVKKKGAITHSNLAKKGNFVMNASPENDLKSKLIKISQLRQKFAAVV